MTTVLRNTFTATSLVAVLLLQPVQALAQEAPAQRVERPAPLLVLGGAAGAAAGIVSFGLIGALVGGNSCGHVGDPGSCRGIEDGLWGAAVGYTVGIPTGVHLANGRAGSLGPSLLTSAAIAGAGVAIGFGIGTHQSIAVAALSAPIVQMVSSVIIERRTARRRLR